MKAIGSAMARRALAMAGGRGPWGGSKGSGSSGEDGGDAGGADTPPDDTRGPRNPWLPPGETGRRSASIEDIFRARDPRKRAGGGGGGGGGGGFPGLPPRANGKSWLPLAIGATALVWLALSSFHMLGPKEEGIVTTFGRYSHTIGQGVSMTFPWPIQTVDVEDVTSIKRDTIPDGEAEKLMLTGDQNLVDLSYLVRWNIKNLRDYRFRLADPEQTVREVAEAAMRSAVAEVTLDEAFSGAGRAEIQDVTRQRMQRVLDYYRAGVLVQGVEIKKADPPASTKAAFEQVTAAQQDADRARSDANAYASKVLAAAEGSASQFDNVYEQYKLAPEVTRRRMYYDTMERVLANNPKVVMEANGVTPFLPLQELRKQAAPDSLPTVVTATPQPAQPQGSGQ